MTILHSSGYNAHISVEELSSSHEQVMMEAYAGDYESKIDGPQGKITFYRKGGSGEMIVFLHADAGSAEQWQDVISLVTRDFQTLALDFRGHGASDAARDVDYSFSARAEDVMAVANHLGWQKFLVVAHSGGAAVALALAGKYPDRIHGLLLIDPPIDPRGVLKEVVNSMVAGLSGGESLSYLKQYYLSISGADRCVQERILNETDATIPASRAGVGKAWAEWDAAAALDAYQGPLKILGTDINDGPYALYALRPDIPHEVIHGTGHWLQIERPNIVADAIRKLVLQIKDQSMRTPAADIMTELVLEVFRLNGMFLSVAETIATPSGLTAARWQVLGAVLNQPGSVADIARCMGLTRQSVQRLTNILTEEGLLDYVDNPVHKRSKLVHISDKGRTVIASLGPRQYAWSNKISKDIGEKPLLDALETLRALTARLEEDK